MNVNFAPIAFGFEELCHACVASGQGGPGCGQGGFLATSEAATAAAVAASDVAKKQGANPEQAAEVAGAAVSLLKCSWPPDAPGSTLTH